MRVVVAATSAERTSTLVVRDGGTGAGETCCCYGGGGGYGDGFVTEIGSGGTGRVAITAYSTAGGSNGGGYDAVFGV